MARAEAGDLEAPTVASLLGSESRVIGGVSLIAEGSAAIALSQGGFRKRYPHTDPNEDAAAFALGEAGVLLAVADGHNGCEAAESAIGELLRRSGALLARGAEASDDGWRRRALETFGAIQTELASRVAQGVRGHSRTTLALALVLPDANQLAFASLGDSHIFRVCPNEVVELVTHAGAPASYLGNPADDLGALAGRSIIGTEALDDTRAVVLATDGISEPGIGVELPEYAVSECAADADRFDPQLRPLELARNVAEAALDAHRRQRSGDNIAAAVSYLPPRDPDARGPR